MSGGLRRDNQSATIHAKCPQCAGRMIYPRSRPRRRVVISRRCPDCQQCDVVLTTRLPAMVWFARNVREREEMAALCDALADGLPFEFDLAQDPGRGGAEPSLFLPDHTTARRAGPPG
jgi:ssDNA-binding Zn-finger/Zn-ribbon topoisomerase 1